MTTVNTQKTFLVYAPDYTDEGALARRMKVRPQHMADAKNLHGLKLGGGFLNPDSPGSPGAPNIIGSMMLVYADSVEEVKEKIEVDVYWTRDVWDKEKLVIAPFLQAPDPPKA